MKLFIVAVALVAFVAANSFDDHTVMYRRTHNDLPRKYTLITDAPVLGWKEDTLVTFNLALKQRNLDWLEETLMAVSSPFSERYGKHVTLEQINAMVAPPTEEKEKVLDWIQFVTKQMDDSIISRVKVVDRADSIKVTAPVAFAERLFRTTLHRFTREKGNDRVFVKFMGSFSIPTHLVGLVELVTGITEFSPIPQGLRIYPETETEAVGATADGKCNVPYTMKRMYQVDPTLTAKPRGASQAPYSEQGLRKEGYGEADLKQFQKINGIDVNPISNIIGNDVASYIEKDTDTEAALDVQCLTGFGEDANTSFWVMDAWMYEFAQEVINTPGAPLVNSISYGWYEIGQCNVDGNCTGLGFPDSETYVTRTDAEFMKCGSMGYTMIAASGDDGVESDKQCDEMRPDFPASSAWILSVGSTAVVSSSSGHPLGSDAPPICTDTSYKCECSTSWNEQSTMKSNNGGFDSGGGFSNWLKQPSYQTAAVQGYLNSGIALPSISFWNSANRGYPDVAAVGAEVAIVKGGSVIKVGGTSASCPIWGGLISLLNQDRLDAGKSSLGFINPVLYAAWASDKTIFHDIIVGTNGGGCANLAFSAAIGWDPVSGLGTPNFAKLRAYVATLP